MDLGKLHEDNYAATLTDFEAEVPFKIDLGNAVVSGRADFVLADRIDECKGMVSASGKLAVIDKGYFKLNHLAQLVLYLGAFKKDLGRLVYGYYELGEEGLVQVASRTFVVTLRKGVIIQVDGVDTDYTTEDITSSIRNAAKWLNTEEFAPRPAKAEQKFGGPCHFCPLKPLCDNIDKGGADFAKARVVAEMLITTKPMNEVKILKINRKRRAKK